MKSLLRIMLVSFFLWFNCGCERQGEPIHTIILIDVSASIEPESQSEAFKTIIDLLKHLPRGDKVEVIPITADALVESPGRILRFEKPVRREAYDADLIRFSKSVSTSLTELQASALAHPGKKTDILGAVRVAEEDIATDPKRMESRLLILSDLIEEDAEMNFRTDLRVADKARARRFASTLVNPNDRPRFARSYAGMLRSEDHALNARRRNAIREFWMAYLGQKSDDVRVVTDGAGLLGSMISSVNH